MMRRERAQLRCVVVCVRRTRVLPLNLHSEQEEADTVDRNPREEDDSADPFHLPVVLRRRRIPEQLPNHW